MDCSPPGSSVHGILQARIPNWVAVSFSRGSSRTRGWTRVSLGPHGLQPTRLLCPWNSLGKNTGVGCHALLQRTFPTQGSNPGLLHCRQILYQLSYQGSPEGTYLNIIKAIYDKPATNTILNMKKQKHSHWNLKQDKDAHTPLLLNIVLKVLAIAIRQEK